MRMEEQASCAGRRMARSSHLQAAAEITASSASTTSRRNRLFISNQAWTRTAKPHGRQTAVELPSFASLSQKASSRSVQNAKASHGPFESPTPLQVKDKKSGTPTQAAAASFIKLSLKIS